MLRWIEWTHERAVRPPAGEVRPRRRPGGRQRPARAGLNQSDTHVDIVIGSPEVQIDGIHADGSVVPVTRGDEFVLKD
jgi:leucyl aminopeptidase (aminopeptidase T)